MEPNFRMIIEDHLKAINANVTMAAYSIVPPGTSVPEYTSDYFRFVYVTKGAGWVTLNGRRYLSAPGQLLMMPAGSRQSYGIDGDESCEMYWCHFHANLGAGDLFEMMNFPVAVEPPRGEYIRNCFKRMVQAFGSDKLTGALRVKSALLDIFAEYLECFELSEIVNPEVGLLAKFSSVVAYIEEHLASNITLDDLAKVAYLHPNYFIVLFKNVMGVSPIQYVNSRRLEAAKRLLVQTDNSVAEIAAGVGLSNHYLSRLFKQQIGISPKRYRQLGRKIAHDGRHIVSIDGGGSPQSGLKEEERDDV